MSGQKRALADTPGPEQPVEGLPLVASQAKPGVCSGDMAIFSQLPNTSRFASVYALTARLRSEPAGFTGVKASAGIPWLVANPNRME